MRCRIHKKKVFILILIVAACGLAFWNSGKQRKNEVFSRDLDTGRYSRGYTLNSVKRYVNVTSVDKVLKTPSDNMTMVYRSLVYQMNFDQSIKNKNVVPNLLKEDSLVIVVQVHNRPDYLKLLVESLRKVSGIENVFLIFSHDFWSADINSIVSSVDFCQTLQIFFPFSIQLYPNEFPGSDPKDCPRNIEKKDAVKLGCINAEYPDSFGHYREAKFSQTKHHWWWKLHFVWEGVKILKDFKGLVLLIEEDHYLSPDFYHVLKKMWQLKNEQCPDCDLLCLGTYAGLPSFADIAGRVQVKTWKSTEHNMGMVMDRKTYRALIHCSDSFCTYDDYNWDWTLQHLTVTCLPKFWKVMVSEVPRVYHAGDCGMHHKKACSPSTEKAKIENLLNKNAKYMFPEAMVVSKTYSVSAISPRVKNGGWGDIRDHELCKSYHRLH